MPTNTYPQRMIDMDMPRPPPKLDTSPVANDDTPMSPLERAMVERKKELAKVAELERNKRREKTGRLTTDEGGKMYDM